MAVGGKTDQQSHPEAGANPALCLSNREIYERICVKSQSLERTLWEGGPSRQRHTLKVRDPRKDKVGRPVRELYLEQVF